MNKLVKKLSKLQLKISSSKKFSKKKNFKFGLFAEKIVMLFLWFCGYRIVAWRYRNHLGEIDIIATKRNLIVFFEVKARKNKTQNHAEILRSNQISRIIAAAEFFVAKNQVFAEFERRFDLILFSGFFRILHHKSYFYS